jgi:dTMP kinase
MLNRGLFITLEGGEGSGKTTQIKRMQAALEKAGRQVVVTREPGGTPDAEKIRALLVQRDGGQWTAMAECLLLFAARTMHVDTLIKPALAEGKIVISDRFTDSTRAYQGYGHGMDFNKIESLNTIAIDGFKPDLTFILDLPVRVGLERAGKRMGKDGSAEDRFERLEIGFHEQMRQGYLDIAQREADRCMVVDAEQGIDDVTAAIMGRLKEKTGHAV